MGTLGGNALPVDVVDGVTIQPQTGAANNMLIGSTKLWTYTVVRTGELVSSSIAARQATNVPCELVKIKAHPANTGYINIGWNAGVTVTDGVEDTSTGFILGGGDDTGWIPIRNLNLLFYKGTVTGDKLTYIAMVS